MHLQLTPQSPEMIDARKVPHKLSSLLVGGSVGMHHVGFAAEASQSLASAHVEQRRA